MKEKAAEIRLNELKEFIGKKPDWVDRLLYVIGDDGEQNRFPSTDNLNKVMDFLVEGLSPEDANKLTAALIKTHWDNVKGNKPNEFMRNTSLFKTAAMRYFQEEVKKNPAMAEEFVNNPIQFVSNVEMPDFLKDVLKEIIDEKLAAKQPFQQFAHNIVFGLISGPLTDVFNKRSATDLQMATASTRIITDTNRMLSQKADNPRTQDVARQLLDGKTIITAFEMRTYVTAMETLMQKLSDNKFPDDTIHKEVDKIITVYEKAFDEKYPFKEKGKVSAAIAGVADSLKRRFKKSPTDNKRPLPEWTEHKAQPVEPSPKRASTDIKKSR